MLGLGWPVVWFGVAVILSVWVAFDGNLVVGGLFKGLAHVAVAVNSIDEALRVFEGQLGFRLEKRRVVEGQRVKAALLKIGDVRFELLEPLDKESTIAKFLEKRGEGIHHVALHVSNIEGHLEELKKKGVRLIDEKPRVGMEGGKIAFLHPGSAKGVLIELVEG
jgi:methylmalonyl-CoA/ethylmalonyl-CoA epimerase